MASREPTRIMTGQDAATDTGFEKLQPTVGSHRNVAFATRVLTA